jgi:hypothetical protein
MPFCYHQIEKQIGDIDKRVIVVAGEGSIPEKRNEALAAARREEADYFAWFDDDDWAATDRLIAGTHRMEGNGPYLSAVGNVRAWFMDPATGMGCRYHAPEGIIFNGAVFRATSVRMQFSRALAVGEDTDWLVRWHARSPYYTVIGTDMHAWLCHQKNVTNRIGTRAFDQQAPGFLSAEERRLIP